MRQCVTLGCEKIKIISNLSNISPGRQSSRASIQIINESIILCCLHLQSQIYSGQADSRAICIRKIVHDVRSTELEIGTEKSIIVGDFNINPFDPGLVQADLFHGIPVYEEAKRERRIVSDEEFFMFYNPMWNLLGDFRKPYGTYYYGGSDAYNPYWNMFDQVIMRPKLRKQFVDDSLKIITETQNHYLLDNKERPDISISDHLPIVFEVKENENE